MDIRMPDTDGLEATRRLTAAAGTGARIIMLTTFDLDHYTYAELTAGASGFLLRDVAPEQLVAAVRLVTAGDALDFQLSDAMVKTHAAGIFHKLSLGDRAQAAVLADETALVVPGGPGPPKEVGDARPAVAHDRPDAA